MSLHEHIRRARSALGLTQAELGTIMGVSQARIAQLEAPGCNMTLETAVKLGRALGLELHFARRRR